MCGGANTVAEPQKWRQYLNGLLKFGSVGTSKRTLSPRPPSHCYGYAESVVVLGRSDRYFDNVESLSDAGNPCVDSNYGEALGHGLYSVAAVTSAVWGTPSRSWTVMRPALGREIRRSSAHLRDAPEVRTITLVTGLFQTSGEAVVGFYLRSPSTRVSPISAPVPGREFSLFTVLLFVVLISFVGFGELQRVLGAANWRRSFSTHAPRRTKRAETIIVILPVAGRGILSDLSPSCQGPNRVSRLTSGIRVAAHDATETKVVCTGGDLTFAARAHHVTGAILIGAQIRSASMHFFGLGRLSRIKRCRRTLWVSGNASHRSELLIVVGSVPIARPLPHISSHVIQAITVRRVMRNRRDADESILTGVRIREVALMCIRHPFPVWPKLVSPYKWLAGEAAARRKLPFCLARQALARPFGISDRVFVGDMDHRIILLA